MSTKFSLHGANALWKIYVPCTSVRSQSSNFGMKKNHYVPPVQMGAACCCLNRAELLLHSLYSFLLPSLPCSLTALQWSQQYCRETCQPLWSSHRGRRESGTEEREGQTAHETDFHATCRTSRLMFKNLRFIPELMEMAGQTADEELTATEKKSERKRDTEECCEWVTKKAKMKWMNESDSLKSELVKTVFWREVHTDRGPSVETHFALKCLQLREILHFFYSIIQQYLWFF